MGAGGRCGAPRFCPSFVQVQKMSRFCPNYVQILSLSNYCLWFVLHVQELSSPNPAFVHNAFSRSRLCPSIVLILDPNPRQNHRTKSRHNLNSLIFKSTTWSHCSWTKLGQFLDFVVDLQAHCKIMRTKFGQCLDLDKERTFTGHWTKLGQSLDFVVDLQALYRIMLTKFGQYLDLDKEKRKRVE